MSVLADMMNAPKVLERRDAARRQMHAELEDAVQRARLLRRIADLHGSIAMGRALDAIALDLHDVADSLQEVA